MDLFDTFSRNPKWLVILICRWLISVAILLRDLLTFAKKYRNKNISQIKLRTDGNKIIK